MPKGKDTEQTKAERVFQLYLRLCEARALIPHGAFEDSKWGDARTFRRTKQLLNDIWERHRGGPLFEVVDAKGVTATKGERFLRVIDESIHADKTERLAVFPAVLEFMNVLKGTIIGDELQPMVARAAARLGQKERARFSRFEKKFLYVGKGMKDYSARREVMDEVYEALLREKHLKVVTEKEGKRSERILRPLSLVMFNNGLYLLAHYDNQGDEEKAYLHRIESFVEACVQNKSPFTYPRGFDPAKVFAGAFGLIRGTQELQEIELEFSPDPAVQRYVRDRKWTQWDRFTEGPGGVLTLTMKAADLTEIRSFVLSFGSKVRVVRPDSLRQEIADTASEMARLNCA